MRQSIPGNITSFTASIETVCRRYWLDEIARDTGGGYEIDNERLHNLLQPQRYQYL